MCALQEMEQNVKLKNYERTFYVAVLNCVLLIFVWQLLSYQLTYVAGNIFCYHSVFQSLILTAHVK
jgi:hypothetical protein